jgi:hypothetical protein
MAFHNADVARNLPQSPDMAGGLPIRPAKIGLLNFGGIALAITKNGLTAMLSIQKS